jgi:hypothetical protein
MWRFTSVPHQLFFVAQLLLEIEKIGPGERKDCRLGHARASPDA